MVDKGVVIEEAGDEASTTVPPSVMLALVTDAYGGYGGIAKYNRDFLGAVASSDLFDFIEVFPRTHPLSVTQVPIGVHQSPAILARLQYALRALVWAVRNKPTIIFNGHLHHGFLSLIIARLVNAKLVSQLHGTEIWQPLTFFQRLSLEASDLILTVSRDTRARTLSQLRIAPERVVVLNNTFSEEFRPGDRQTARANFGVGDEFTILTVSRLSADSEYKGHGHIIRTIPALVELGFDVSYLIAGSGPGKSELERLATSIGVNDRLQFLGMVPDDKLPALYRAADLFALPSIGEGFGIVFLEAMACGTPVIGLDVGGTPDALADGILGTCCSLSNFSAELIAAVKNAGNNFEYLPKKVNERFGKKIFKQKAVNIIKTALF